MVTPVTVRMTAHALAALHCTLLSSQAKTFEFVSGKSDGQNRYENPFGRLHSRVAWSPATHSDCTRMVIIYSPVNPKSITHETVSIRTKLAKNLISRIDLGVLAKATSPRFPSPTTVQASPKKSAAASSIRSSHKRSRQRHWTRPVDGLRCHCQETFRQNLLRIRNWRGYNVLHRNTD